MYRVTWRGTYNGIPLLLLLLVVIVHNLITCINYDDTMMLIVKLLIETCRVMSGNKRWYVIQVWGYYIEFNKIWK